MTLLHFAKGKVMYMKIRKFCAVAVSIILIVCAVSCAAFAEETAVYDTHFENKKSFISSLGGFDTANILPSSAVTRAEFTAMAMSVIPYNTTDEVTDIYIDVTADTAYAKEITKAYQSGVISVGFDRRFNPQKNITFNEAIKIVVATLGYSQLADVWGGYPYGYIKAADSLDIVSGSFSGDAVMKGSDAVDIIYNAFTAPVLIADSVINGEATYSRDESRNVLTEYYHLTNINGLVTSAGHSSLRSNYSYSPDTFEINGKNFKSDMKNADGYVGYEVRAWIDSDGNVKCVEKSSDVSEVVVQADEIADYSGNVLSVWSGDKEKKYNLNPGYTFLKNGSAIIASSSDFMIDDGRLILIDNDSDRQYDVVKSEEVKFLWVKNIDGDGRIYDANRASFANGSFITCSAEIECYYDISIFDEDTGMYVAGKLSDIKPDTVLSVRENANGTYSEIVISDITVSGAVEEASEDILTVGGVAYAKSEYFKTNYLQVSAGKTGVFYVSAEGKLVAYSQSASTNMKYAYLMDAAVKSGMESEFIIKVLEASGQKTTYSLCSKVKLNGNFVNENDVTLRDSLIENGFPKYGLIKYSLNEKGEVNAIDTPSKAFNGDSVEDIFSASASAANPFRQYMDKDKLWFKYYAKTAVGNFNFGSTVIFRVPEAIATNPAQKFDENYFKVSDISYMNDDHKCVADSFDYNSDYQPAAVVMYDITGGASGAVVEEIPGHYAPTWLVDEVSTAINHDGEYTTKLVLYNGTRYAEKYIAYDLNSQYVTDGKIPTPGDVIRICEVSDGIISGLMIDVDYNPTDKSVKINYTNSGVSNSISAYLTYVEGTAFSSSANSLSIIADSIPSVGSLIDTPYSNLFVFKATDANAACFDTGLGRAVPAYVKDIVGSSVSATNPDRVVVKCSSGTFSTVFIYK